MTKLLAAVVFIAACGKSDPDTNKAAAATAAPAAAIDLAGVNALVPAELKAKLAFEKTDIVEERGHDKVTYTLAAPKGWKQDSKMFATLKGGDDVGFMTQLHVGTNCDGACEPKDWAKTADKDFAQFADAKVISNDATPTSRMLIASRDNTTFVWYAWWRATDRRYYMCHVTLEQPVAAAAPAFAKACQAVSATGDF